jgi:hypothetical protein
MGQFQYCLPFVIVEAKGVRVKSIPDVIDIHLEGCLPVERKRRLDIGLGDTGVINTCAVCSGSPGIVLRTNLSQRQVETYQAVTIILAKSSQRSAVV